MNHERRVTQGAAALVGGLMVLLLVAACTPTLGGPANTFGNDPTRAGAQPGLWASINGPYSPRADGDPYAVKCAVGPASATSCNGSGANPDYDPTGYLWSIDVPQAAIGTPVTVAIFDPAASSSATGEPQAHYASFATSFHLFDTTGSSGTTNISPSNGMDSLARCNAGTGYQVFAAGTHTSEGAWYTLCRFTPTIAGVYPLQVRSSGIPGVVDSGDGSNNFSIRATTPASTQPIVNALTTESVRIAATSGQSQSYLATIPSFLAGHDMVIDLFDPGDGSSATEPFTVQVLAPPASGAAGIVPTGGTPVACAYNSVPSYTFGPATPDVAGTCTIMTQPPSSISPIYDGSWLRLRITIPANYTCSTNCWWSIVNRFGNGTPSDRLIWRLNVSDTVPS